MTGYAFTTQSTTGKPK